MATTKTTAPKAAAATPKAVSARKPAPPQTAAATSQPAAVAATPVVASLAPQPERATVTVKLKDMLDQVVQATGGKKKGVKEIVEATLKALGDALHNGHDLNLPPLGKAKVSRQRDLETGEMIIVKLRRGTAKAAGQKTAKEALAATED